MDGCVLCVLSGRGLCDGLIIRPEESYRLWCVLVCNLGTCRMSRRKLIKGCKCQIENIYVYIFNLLLEGFLSILELPMLSRDTCSSFGGPLFN
jgi:hypothetical protein